MRKTQIDTRRFAARLVLKPHTDIDLPEACNELRRTLLSGIEGTAVTEARVEGLMHEYSFLPGVREDGLQIVRNLSKLRVRLDGMESAVLRLDRDAAGVVTAGDFTSPDGAQVINPDLPIAVLSAGGKLHLSATVCRGAGYAPPRPAEPGRISVGALFNPIELARCSAIDIGIQVDLVTNGVVTAVEAVSQALTICGIQAEVEESDLPEEPLPAVPEELKHLFSADDASDPVEPDLLALPRDSYARFLDVTLLDMIRSFFPMSDAQGSYSLRLQGITLVPPANDPKHCMDHGLTYGHDLVLAISLASEAYGRSSAAEVKVCSIPAMTQEGTFIIDSAPRCIVGELLEGFRYQGPGELVAEVVREVLERMRPVVVERLNALELDSPVAGVASIGDLPSLLQLDSAIRSFFTASPLCQYADETDPLSLVVHARRMVLPILHQIEREEAVSGPAGSGQFRRLKPYEERMVDPLQYGRVDPFESPEGPNIGLIHSAAANTIADESGVLKSAYLKVKDRRVTDEIVWLAPHEEEQYVIAGHDVERKADGLIGGERIPGRKGCELNLYKPEEIDLIDASPSQTLGPSAALIPFLGNDDAIRVTLGSNMQRQAVPLIEPESPLIYTGMESRVARDGGSLVTASGPGTVTEVSADRIVVHTSAGDHLYRLLKFRRSNQAMCLNYTPVVKPGDRVSEGQAIAVGPSTTEEGLSLGRNVLVAYMPFRGSNFEDAIAISEDLVSGDVFTSIHFKKLELDVPEDDIWVIPEGSSVRDGDVLVQELKGKRRPLLVVPPYTRGRVSGIIRRGGHLSMFIARRSPATPGDKFAGRHGNKGVIARVFAREDMPFMEDGTPVQMVLDPLGVISRMNMGQILETHWGFAASRLGHRLRVSPYHSPDQRELCAALLAAGLPESGAVTLYDGETGKPFDSPVTVGYLYMMKLVHLTEDKIHARSTGPYSLATGQPLGDRVPFGGQRFGKLEILALEAYGAKNLLNEVMNVKSEDACGYGGLNRRPRALESVEDVMRGLALDVQEGQYDPLLRISLASPNRILEQSGGGITQPELYDEQGSPVQGGLFDRSVFGHDGRRMGHIELAGPVFHPWFIERIKLLLDLDELPDAEKAREMLSLLDLENLKSSLRNSEAIKERERLRLVSHLIESATRPEWMMLTVLPVVPPTARPLVKLAEGGAIGANLNELYRAVISRNNGLLETPGGDQTGKRMAENAARMLQEAVDKLLGNGESVPGSLTDLLASKNGLLNRNLDGKRQDYSGRSVLVSGPELRLDECGVPVRMALDLFRPFVAEKLVQQGAARDMSAALNLIDSDPDSKAVRKAVEAVADERLILLNRAPTRHRLSIQPFKPVLVDHEAIAMHPLVTYAFNADFDGDQAAIHIPITSEGLSECRHILDARLNLVSPGTGEPIASPVQDMVLGLYYLTADPGLAEPPVGLGSLEEVSRAGLHIHRRIKLGTGAHSVETTVGRAVFNSVLPEELRFVNEIMTRESIWSLVTRCLDTCGREATVRLLNDLDDLGFRYATQYAATLSIGNLRPLPEREEILKAAWKQDDDIRRKLRDGRTGADEASINIWHVWQEALNKLKAAAKDHSESADALLDPVYAMVASGARGNYLLLARLLGLYGTAPVPCDPEMEQFSILPVPGTPVTGMSAVEQFAGSWTSRRGLVNTLKRMDDIVRIVTPLIALCRDLYVTAEDCGDGEGTAIEPLVRNDAVLESIAQRVAGRYSAEDITDPGSGKVLVSRGELITREVASAVEDAGIESVRIRSVLTCRERDGMCSKCYGVDLSTGEPVAVGAAVGVLASQAILELTERLTMQTSYYNMPPTKTTAPPGVHEFFGFQGLERVLSADGIPADEGWIVRTILTIFREQGAPLNDKHAEVVGRLMGRFVCITDPGDTLFLPGEAISIAQFECANSAVESPAKGEHTILGVREASVLGTDSFLVSAMLGDTSGVLADAALQGACDDLDGVRERIIAGLPLVEETNQ